MCTVQIDMCNALGIEPVITTTETNNAQEFADLVEYCHGDESTAQGKKRIADGHPSKYDVKYFELGNEQCDCLQTAPKTVWLACFSAGCYA